MNDNFETAFQNPNEPGLFGSVPDSEFQIR